MNKSLQDLIIKAITNNGWIDLPAEGNSMFPFIQEGNLCRFESCEPSMLQKGNVILFRCSTGELVAHRFCKIMISDGVEYYIFKGDTNLGCDDPVPKKSIIGKLISIQKQHFKIRLKHNPFAQCWGILILKHNILSSFLRSYLNRKEKLQY